MPVDARRLIRKMRGGAQAHLIEAADDHCYVVKFLNNPQHRRILVNEWIASVFLRYLGIATPETTVIRVTQDFLDQNPEVHFQLGSHREPVELGWHFGSRFPGDPARLVVYDFLPDTLLAQVVNRAEFLGMLVFDQWMGNADSRQAIFFRARLRDWLPAHEAHPQRLGFVAQMVDHGFAFDGPHWRFGDSPLQGLYFRPGVYQGVRGLDDFQPWLDRIVHFPEAVVDQALKQMPPAWVAGDEGSLNQLCESLLRRRRRVVDLIQACRNGRAGLFPEWH
ncbi:MAG TPA: HipA family kinase [Bryobacteraceae bacterium]|nr:HipA family kinase [Bryobacteraceae bacterium]